jgi:hypothetical protein
MTMGKMTQAGATAITLLALYLGGSAVQAEPEKDKIEEVSDLEAITKVIQRPAKETFAKAPHITQLTGLDDYFNSIGYEQPIGDDMDQAKYEVFMDKYINFVQKVLIPEVDKRLEESKEQGKKAVILFYTESDEKTADDNPGRGSAAVLANIEHKNFNFYAICISGKELHKQQVEVLDFLRDNFSRIPIFRRYEQDKTGKMTCYGSLPAGVLTPNQYSERRKELSKFLKGESPKLGMRD